MHIIIEYPIEYRKIEARLTRVGTVKRKTPVCERGCRRGVRFGSKVLYPGMRRISV